MITCCRWFAYASCIVAVAENFFFYDHVGSGMHANRVVKLVVHLDDFTGLWSSLLKDLIFMARLVQASEI